MSSFDVARSGDFIVLMRCEGPFGIPAARWELTTQEAEQIAKILTEAAKSMRKRASTVSEVPK